MTVTQEAHTDDASASASAFINDNPLIAEAAVAPWLAQMAQHALTLRPHADVEGLTITVRWRPHEATTVDDTEPEVA